MQGCPSCSHLWLKSLQETYWVQAGSMAWLGPASWAGWLLASSKSPVCLVSLCSSTHERGCMDQKPAVVFVAGLYVRDAACTNSCNWQVAGQLTDELAPLRWYNRTQKPMWQHPHRLEQLACHMASELAAHRSSPAAGCGAAVAVASVQYLYPGGLLMCNTCAGHMVLYWPVTIACMLCV